TPGGTGSNACQNNPCLNGGSCQNLSGGYFGCICSSAYTGTRCEVFIGTPGGAGSNACQNNPCLNGGSCQNVTGGDFRCI
ncbi:unnamed protein product, partial [Rotaria magnacalcarata]